MLKHDRQEVFERIQTKIEKDLNYITNFNGVYVDTAYGYDQNYIDGQSVSTPFQAQGWPPELVSYIKRLTLMITYEVLDSIYTEYELVQKSENILLDRDEPEQNR
jgi:hypothetical protein